MLTTRSKLTVAQAARPAVVADCVKCGGQAIFLAATDDASVDHRCGTGVVGATWSLVERPRRTARSAEARARLETMLDGGVLTAEQARAQSLAVAARAAAEAVA